MNICNKYSLKIFKIPFLKTKKTRFLKFYYNFFNNEAIIFPFNHRYLPSCLKIFCLILMSGD